MLAIFENLLLELSVKKGAVPRSTRRASALGEGVPPCLGGVGGTLGGASLSAVVCAQIHLRKGCVQATQTLGCGGGGRDVGRRSPVGEEICGNEP